jgi:trigger factor
LEPSQSASVEVTVDIEPEFNLPKYKEFELTIEPTEVSEDEVTKELDAIREQRASFDVVERASEKGDYVKCSYEGSLDGKAVSEILPDKPMYGKPTPGKKLATKPVWVWMLLQMESSA